MTMTGEDTQNNRRSVEVEKRHSRDDASVSVSEDRYCAHNDNMEYAWLEPRHDPIATDTNLAEIDFEDFKNEDLAFAFSCGVSLIKVYMGCFSMSC